eukprot:6342152-Amphidinium_carterae.1
MVLSIGNLNVFGPFLKTTPCLLWPRCRSVTVERQLSGTLAAKLPYQSFGGEEQRRVVRTDKQVLRAYRPSCTARRGWSAAEQPSVAN